MCYKTSKTGTDGPRSSSLTLKPNENLTIYEQHRLSRTRFRQEHGMRNVAFICLLLKVTTIKFEALLPPTHHSNAILILKASAISRRVAP
jgi:hypothetical protein